MGHQRTLTIYSRRLNKALARGRKDPTKNLFKDSLFREQGDDVREQGDLLLNRVANEIDALVRETKPVMTRTGDRLQGARGPEGFPVYVLDLTPGRPRQAGYADGHYIVLTAQRGGLWCRRETKRTYRSPENPADVTYTSTHTHGESFFSPGDSAVEDAMTWVVQQLAPFVKSTKQLPAATANVRAVA
jgi:hypothetical protein